MTEIFTHLLAHRQICIGITHLLAHRHAHFIITQFKSHHQIHTIQLYKYIYLTLPQTFGVSYEKQWLIGSKGSSCSLSLCLWTITHPEPINLAQDTSMPTHQGENHFVLCFQLALKTCLTCVTVSVYPQSEPDSWVPIMCTIPCKNGSNYFEPNISQG